MLTRAEDRRHGTTWRTTWAYSSKGATSLPGRSVPALEACAPLDADALCSYLHQCVSWDRQAPQCPLEPTDLDWQLTGDLLMPAQPLTLGDQYVQTLTIKTWTPSLRTYCPGSLERPAFSVALPCALGTQVR